MTDAVIRAEGLGKRYRIGARRESYRTLRESIVSAARRVVTAPFRAAARLGRRAPASEHIWALKDVSFEVERGAVVGIIGRNGAGKTTLLKVLSRITEPTEGTAELRGRVGSLLEVGTGFHPELTGRENVYLNGAILGMKRREISAKFDEIVSFAEVERFIDTPVKRYSAGMYMRLAFAVAAHLETEILLVDEVLAVGDAAFQKKCLGKMGDVAARGRTVLFVSHNMGAVAGLCPNSILLNMGRIGSSGESREVIAGYLSGGEPVSTEDISEHPNRPRKYRPLLTRFQIKSRSDAFCHGQPLTFRIGYHFAQPVHMPEFCIVFFTMHGVRAFSLNSAWQQNDIPRSLAGSGEVVCRIRSLPLLPGSYRLMLKLWQQGQQLDEVSDAGTVRVEMLDEEGVDTSKWNSALGVVYVDADWELV